MKIPSKIRIKYRVSYEILYSPIIKDDAECMGFTCEDKRQIILKSDMSETNLEKTLIHEVIHAVDFENKIGLTHKQVYQLEEALYRLLKLNKFI